MTASNTIADATAEPKYRLILELGQGGMSRVYLAAARGVGGFKKLLVVKRLLPELAQDPEFLEMFLEEARLSARLNHANIVQINEVGYDGAHHYMAMEYLEGQSLDSISRRAKAQGTTLPMNMHLQIICDACMGLHYAHELTDLDGNLVNLVHRDVSPHNVFVTYSGQVKLLDFGIAKAADSSQQTRTGVLKGKCGYMAPEQFGGKAVDRRADIFAVGVMIWQAITGQRLWKNLSDIEIFQRLAAGDVPSPTSAKPDLDAEIVAICERALAMDPANRYPNVAELVDDLDRFLDRSPPRLHAREIGKHVAEMFSDARAKVQGAIEAELQRPSLSLNRTAEVPILLPEDDDRSQALLRSTQSLPPETAAAASLRGAADFEQHTALMSGTINAAPPPSTAVPSMQLGSPPAKSSATLWLLLAAVGLLAIGATIFVVKSRAATPTAQTSQSTTTGGAQDFTELSVEAQPPQAAVFVDEVQLSSNPGTARFVRDKLPHRIRAEASGFTSSTQLVVYDQAQQNVSIKLLPAASASTSAVAKAQPPPPVVTGRRHDRGTTSATTTAATATTTTVPATTAPTTTTTPAGSSRPALERNIFND